MPDFLIVSLVLSVVLTVALNVGPRLFPRTRERAARRLEERLDQRVPDPHGRRVQVFFPWKAMLVGSVVLTILINLANWLA